MWMWLDKHGVDLFGIDFLDVVKDPTEPGWERYEKMLNDVVSQIMMGYRLKKWSTANSKR